MNKMWIMAVAGCIGVAAVTLADECSSSLATG